MLSEIHDPTFERRYQAAIGRARERSAALAGPSLAERFARLPRAAREEILAGLSTPELARLRYDWAVWARPKQDPPLEGVPHRILFLLGGRGAGKTISGANRIRRRVEAGARSLAIVGPTLRDIERYQINGEGGSDGILTVFPARKRPQYKPHKAVVFFHRPECAGCTSAEACGGAVAYVNSAEDPEFRGPNLDTVWCDEPAKWRYLSTIWNNIELATRLRGRIPLEIVLTGTPLPLQLFRELIADDETVTILMSQHENATNLDPSYLARMRRKYGGTRLGRQELEGEILSDNPDALFQASILDATRVEDAPVLEEVAVAVDPAIATNEGNDETGIIAGGRDAAGHIYILVDMSSRAKPEKWGADVIATCTQLRCDTVVGERNRGGDLVAANVRAAKERRAATERHSVTITGHSAPQPTSAQPLKALAAASLKIVEVHATRGKLIRAEPVSSLHEKGMIHIVGRMPELETELTEWNPRVGGRSPSRLDALVWLVWYLARLGEEEKPDLRAGFKGLSGAAAATSQPSAATAAAAALVGELPRSGWSRM